MSINSDLSDNEEETPAKCSHAVFWQAGWAKGVL